MAGWSKSLEIPTRLNFLFFLSSSLLLRYNPFFCSQRILNFLGSLENLPKSVSSIDKTISYNVSIGTS